MSGPLRVMFCGTGWLAIVPLIERSIAAVGVDAQMTVIDRTRPLAPQLDDIDVALPSNAPFGATEINAARRLRLIQQPAAGYERIDVAAAHARGVPVANAPGSNSDAVAQAALLLLLALARRWHLARKAFVAGEVGVPLGIELNGRTLVVVGMGGTGSRLAVVARALGMQVLGAGSSDGRAGLLALLARADAVSIHCPLTPATHHLFDDAAFAAMRPGAFIVNVARGAIIERAALDRALADGRLGGVGLDVFWEEPWSADDPMFARDDVVVLPHIAGSTEEAFARIAAVVAANIAAIARGTPLIHRVDG